MGTVLFLTGDSRGDALRLMGQSYEALFKAQGYDFLQIDFRDQGSLIRTLNHVVDDKPIEFAFSFMNYGATLLANDENGKCQNLWQGIGAPFLSLIGDSPAYYFDLHVCRVPNHACLYGFPEHEVLRRRLPQLTNGFIGGFQSLLLDMLDLQDLDFKAKAGGQLFFLKNGNDPQQLWDSWNALKGRPLQALRELADYLTADLANPKGNQIDDIVTDYFAGIGFDISALPKLRLFFIAQLDDYYRRLKSTMMAKALMDFPVQIIGTHWDHLDFSGKRVTYVNDCNYAESTRLIRDSLGVVDMSPNTGLAPHDRPCRAFGAYTLCVTNEQEFFQKKLPHHEEFSFRFDRDSFQGKIADVLAHPTRFVDIGIEVAKAFRRVNPPEAAVRQLIDTAALVKLDQRRDHLPGSPDYFVWPPGSLS